MKILDILNSENNNHYEYVYARNSKGEEFLVINEQLWRADDSQKNLNLEDLLDDGWEMIIRDKTPENMKC